MPVTIEETNRVEEEDQDDGFKSMFRIGSFYREGLVNQTCELPKAIRHSSMLIDEQPLMPESLLAMSKHATLVPKIKIQLNQKSEELLQMRRSHVVAPSMKNRVPDNAYDTSI